MSGRIHISQETADRLIAAGKSSWIIPRESKIIAKGKGELQTYWLNHALSCNSTIRSSEDSTNRDETMEILGRDLLEDRVLRLINWNVELLLNQLRQIVRARVYCMQFVSSKKLSVLTTNSCIEMKFHRADTAFFKVLRHWMYCHQKMSLLFFLLLGSLSQSMRFDV
jgi:hypothetical protein